MLNELVNALEMAGWPTPVYDGASAHWRLPDMGTVYHRYIRVTEGLEGGGLLLTKHVIGGISGGSFDTVPALFQLLLPYTDMVTA